MFLVGITVTLRSKLGCLLQFVTLIAVVVTIGAAIKIGAPQIDLRLSARPLAPVRADGNAATPGCRFWREAGDGVRPTAFYNDQTVSRYGWVPNEEHLLIARRYARFDRPVCGRPPRGSSGKFAAQRLEYYWGGVSSN